jgi:hypothetical protein
MNSMRALSILAIALCTALPVAAFRPRPVSDLQFESRLSATTAVAAASDGEDYLVLLQQYNGGTYTQAVSHGVPYGPATLIGIGTGNGGAVVWTGLQYLVFWSGKSGVCVSGVSRNGTLLSGPTLIIAGSYLSPRATSNGRRILVTAYTLSVNGLRAVLVELNGIPAGQVVIDTPSIRDHAITGTSDGFALATFGYVETRLYRFDDSGQQRVAGGTRLEGPYGATSTSYHTLTGAIASEGSSVAVIYCAPQYQMPSQLRTAIVGANGEIVQAPRTILTGLADESGILPTSALWTGTEYVATLALRRDINAIQVDPALQRISRSGQSIEAPSSLQNATGRAMPTAMATNGREYLIAIAGPAALSLVRVPIGSNTPTEPVNMTRALNRQDGLVIAGGKRDYLAAWAESDHNGFTVRASRIDARGRYLDGTGIVLATTAALPQISVDSDGENWLVIWNKTYLVQGRRVSADGVMLDAQPIAITGGYLPTVRWGHDSWLVVTSATMATVQILGTSVSRDGIVGATTMLDQLPSGSYYQNLALAFDGQRFFLAVIFDTPWCANAVQPYCGNDYSLASMQLDGTGHTVLVHDTLPLDDTEETPVAVATNGPRHLIVYQRYGKIAGLLLNDGAAPLKIAIADGWATPSVMWSGSAFVVAVARTALQLISISDKGNAGPPVAAPLDLTDHTSSAAFPPSFPASMTTTPVTGPPLAILTTNDNYDAVQRGAFAFIADFDDALHLPQPPPVPSIGRAVADRDGVTLFWPPQTGALGFSIELKQPDGSERAIAVATGAASSTHLTYPGLGGTTLRLRAWNTGGISAPSAEVQPASRTRAAGR